MNTTEPKQIYFSLRRLPPSLNELLSSHWRKRYDLKKIYDEIIGVEWLRLNKLVFTKPVKLIYVLSFSGQRRQRDLDNYIGGTKLMTDALKRTFLFRDDSEWITSIEVKFTRGNEGTVIFIKEDV